MIPSTLWYAGKKCMLVDELSSIDMAQFIIDGWKYLGIAACATHEGGKHQLYVESKNQSNDAYGPSMVEPIMRMLDAAQVTKGMGG